MGARTARPGIHHCAPYVHAHHGRVCGCAPQAHKRRGNQGSPCLLRITTPSFRARCARKSKWRFGVGSPAASKGKQKWAAAPEGRASRARTPAPGRSVAFMQTAGASQTSTAPPPPGSGARQNRRDVIANQIFPQNVDKFVCGRGQPWVSSGGGDPQEGVKTPSCPPAPRRRTVPRAPQHAKSPAREVRAHVKSA